MSTSEHRLRGLLFVCTAGVLWGLGGLLVQLIRRHVEFSPLVLSSYRTLIAAAFLLAVVFARRGGGLLVQLTRAEPRRTIWVGLGTAAYQALYFSSVVLVGVTVSTVVSLGVAPVVVAIITAARRRRFPSSFMISQILMALTGLVLVSGSVHSALGSSASVSSGGIAAIGGIALAVASGTGFAFATLGAERLASGTDPLTLTTATTLVGAVVLSPFLVLARGPKWTVEPTVLILLVLLGTATFALAYGLLYAGLRHTTSSAAVLATLLEPVTAALAATIILGERLSGAGVLGMALVLGAIALTLKVEQS